MCRLAGYGSIVPPASARDGINSPALIERYGPDISTVDLLRHLTALCRYQRAPGAPSARKYEQLCLTAITLPPPVKKIPPVPPGVPYTVEIWRETGGNIELHLATIYPLNVAIAAFEAACLEWPMHMVTLRDRARIVRRRERPPQSASASGPGGSL
jgi:hypothetical protein